MEYIDKNAKRKDISEDYRIGVELGSGAFSVVKQGTHRTTREKVAIKIIDKIKHRKQLPLISSEIETLTLLQGNNNVVKLYSVYEDSTTLYIVMEVISGGELFDKIIEKGYYSEKDGATIILTILQAVNYCHSNNVVHRDLKPENLLCSQKNYSTLTDLKLVDFGFASHLKTGQKCRGSIGSPSYIAPEAILDIPYDFSVDMWSIGVISYVILGGYAPFDKKDPMPLNKQITTGKYQFHKDEWTEVGPIARDFISKLLVVKPENRMTVSEALKHPFILDPSKASEKVFGGTLERLTIWNAERKLRAIGFAVVSKNRFKMLAKQEPEPVRPKEGISLRIVNETVKQKQNQKKSIVHQIKNITVTTGPLLVDDLATTFVPNSIHLHSFDDPTLMLVGQRYNLLHISEAKATWNILSEKKGDQLVEIFYEVDNLHWSSTYTAIINPTLSSITLTGFYNITNLTGKSFKTPNITLLDDPREYVLTSELLSWLTDGDQIRFPFLDKSDFSVIPRKVLKLFPNQENKNGFTSGHAKDILVVENLSLVDMPEGTVSVYQVQKNSNKQEYITNTKLEKHMTYVQLCIGEDNTVTGNRFLLNYFCDNKKVTENIKIEIISKKGDTKVIVEDFLLFPAHATVTSDLKNEIIGNCVFFDVLFNNPNSIITFNYTVTYLL